MEWLNESNMDWNNIEGMRGVCGVDICIDCICILNWSPCFNADLNPK